MTTSDTTQARQRIADEIEITRAQITACREHLALASQQFAFAQSVLAEARDRLDVAEKSLHLVADTI